MEKVAESILYASRWLLAPIYIGLSLALVLLSLKFFEELIHFFPLVFSSSEADLILVVLSLIDIALVGGLLVMVMFSGYENFVSRIDLGESVEKLAWLGKLDSGSLKQKVAASIVAISSIHLLKVFMEVESKEEMHLRYYCIIHIIFVLSAIGISWLDRMNKSNSDDKATTS